MRIKGRAPKTKATFVCSKLSKLSFLSVQSQGCLPSKQDKLAGTSWPTEFTCCLLYRRLIHWSHLVSYSWHLIHSATLWLCSAPKHIVFTMGFAFFGFECWQDLAILRWVLSRQRYSSDWDRWFWLAWALLWRDHFLWTERAIVQRRFLGNAHFCQWDVRLGINHGNAQSIFTTSVHFQQKLIVFLMHSITTTLVQSCFLVVWLSSYIYICIVMAIGDGDNFFVFKGALSRVWVDSDEGRKSAGFLGSTGWWLVRDLGRGSFTSCCALNWRWKDKVSPWSKLQLWTLTNQSTQDSFTNKSPSLVFQGKKKDDIQRGSISLKTLRDLVSIPS